MRVRPPFVVVASLLIGAPALEAKVEPPTVASDEEEAHALRHLDADDPKEVAWGAYAAAEHRIQAAVPRRVARLRATAPDDDALFPLRAALLDALVVLDPVVDPAVLRPRATGRLLHGVVTVLGRHPDRYGPACLDLFTSVGEDTTSWLALGNVRAAAPTPGFGAALLAGLEVRLTVRVWTHPSDLTPEPSGTVCGCGCRRIPAGWPPTVLHRLFRADRDDAGNATVFAGPHPIRSERRESRDGQVWTCSSVERSDVDPMTARVEWLGACGACPEPLAAPATLDVMWQSRRAYLRTVVGRRDAALNALRAAVARMRATHLLSPDEARAFEPRVRVVVEDRRASPWRPDVSLVPPIPPIPPVRARRRSAAHRLARRQDDRSSGRTLLGRYAPGRLERSITKR